MLSGLVVGIVMLEIGLRIAGISYPSFYTIDEHSCTALRPGAEGWYRKEGGSYVIINSDGLRDKEHSKEKPLNTLRIAVLGDSYAAAYEVPLENTFWSVMEQDIKNCDVLAGQEIEIINFGVAGYGTAQELMTLRYRVWDYNPDIVVLSFVTRNDIRNNSRELGQDPLRPYFVYQNGELVLDSSCVESASYRARQTWYAQLGYRIVNSSRVLQLLNEAKNFLTRYRIETNRADHDSVGLTQELGLDDMVYLEPNDPVWAEAWRVTEVLIMLMRDEVIERGAKFFVVTLSNPIQVYPYRSKRDMFMESLGIHDLFYPDSRIKELGELEGYLVLNLVQPFQTYAEEHKAFLHGFDNTTMGEGHWNIEGHSLAGQIIAQEICQNLLSSR